MKKSILISLLIGMMCVIAFMGCERETINPNEGQPQRANDSQINQQGDLPEQTGIIKSIHLDSAVCYSLDELFCSTNSIIENIMRGDTLFRIINNRQELIDIGGEGISDLIDFDKYYIIWGRVIAPHSGCNIDSCQLVCNGGFEYTFTVNVYIGSEGYQVITPLYFWEVYSKKERVINCIINLYS